MGKGSAPRSDIPTPGDPRTPRRKYKDNWDAAFGPKSKRVCAKCGMELRQDGDGEVLKCGVKELCPLELKGLDWPIFHTLSRCAEIVAKHADTPVTPGTTEE
jgi:hypothetical protein